MSSTTALPPAGIEVLKVFYRSVSEWLHSLETNPTMYRTWIRTPEYDLEAQEWLALWREAGRPHVPWPSPEQLHLTFHELITAATSE